MLRITPIMYRGEAGFSISGYPESAENRKAFPVKVFTKTRASAERIRDRLNEGKDVRMQDFLLGQEETPEWYEEAQNENA